jgi:GNAT superfamily N-acetyltransferase
MFPAHVTVRCYAELDDPAAVAQSLDAIFFEASATRSFPDEATRLAFRDRWLGRYLNRFPHEAFLAFAPGGQVAGYIVGCLEDPVSHPLFHDIAYFALFSEPTLRYPAHLHINLSPEYRGFGIGQALIETFAFHASAHGVGGMHAVTGDGSRNNSFYERCGFQRLAEAEVSGKRLVFFARPTARGAR